MRSPSLQFKIQRIPNTRKVEKAYRELLDAYEAMDIKTTTPQEAIVPEQNIFKSIKIAYNRALNERPAETLAATVAFGTFLLKVIDTFSSAKSRNAYANMEARRYDESLRKYKRRLKNERW
jgi:hypothetical protein